MNEQICVKPATAGTLVKRGWTSMKTVCEYYDGRWLEQHQECEDLTQNVCEELGGQYQSCASGCRNIPPRGEPIICAQVCVQVCQFS